MNTNTLILFTTKFNLFAKNETILCMQAINFDI
jgi:hypothetical protein